MRKAFVFNQAWQSNAAGKIERIIPDGETPPALFLTSNGLCDIVDIPDGADENHLAATFNEQWDKDFQKKVQVTLTQADDTQYDVVLDGNTQCYTSTTGQTAAQIVTALLAALSYIAYTFTDNGDGTYDIEANDVGRDFSESYDANQSSALTQAHHETTGIDPVDETYTYSSWYTIAEDTAAKDAAQVVSDVGVEYSTMKDGMYTDLNTQLATKVNETATRRYLTAKIMKDDPTFFSASGTTAEIATTTYAVGDALDTDAKVTAYADEVIAAAKQFSLDANLKANTFRVNKAAIEA